MPDPRPDRGSIGTPQLPVKWDDPLRTVFRGKCEKCGFHQVALSGAKISFDHFHVMMLADVAVDTGRKEVAAC